MARQYQCLALLLWLFSIPTLAMDLSLSRDIRFAFQADPVTQYEPKVDRATYQTLEKAAKLIEKEKLKQAKKELSLALSRSPSPALWYGLAQIQQQQGQWPQAERSLLSALEIMPDFQRAHQALGAVLSRSGKYDRARQHLLRANPQTNLAAHYRLLGYGYLQQKNFLAAQMAYQQALIHQSDNRNALYGLLQAAFGANDLSLAAAVLAQLQLQAPADVDLWQMQANIAIAQGQWLKAITALEVANRLAPSAQREFRLAKLYLQQQQYRLAVPYLHRLAAKPDQIEPKALVETAQFLIDRDQYALVKPIANQLIKQKGLTAQLNSDLFYLLGQIARAEQKPNQAKTNLERALKYNSQNGPALIELAKLEPKRKESLLLKASYLPDVAITAKVALAQHLIEQEAYQRAHTLLVEVQKREPNNRHHQQNLKVLERLLTLQ